MVKDKAQTKMRVANGLPANYINANELYKLTH